MHIYLLTMVLRMRPECTCTHIVLTGNSSLHGHHFKWKRFVNSKNKTDITEIKELLAEISQFEIWLPRGNNNIPHYVCKLDMWDITLYISTCLSTFNDSFLLVYLGSLLWWPQNMEPLHSFKLFSFMNIYFKK